MVVRNKQKSKNLFSILGVVMLSLVGISTVFGNTVSATEVYPTITNTHQESNSSLDSVGKTLSEIFSQFVVFVKEWVKENNWKVTKHTFDISQDANKILNNTEDEFSDISNHPDKEYINFIAKKNIVSSNREEFKPENFVRLHELIKILVNSYRFKLWYNLDSNIWLTDSNYFEKPMPKYYNTAYEMWLLEWVYSIDDFERYLSYEDLKVVLSNFNVQYPELINLLYLDIENSDRTLKRWEVSRVVVNSLMLNQNNQLTFRDTISSEYSQAIEKLAQLEIVNANNKNFYPSEKIVRGDFVVMLVKSYLKATNQEMIVDNMNFDIEDLDYNSVYAPYVVYAQENALIDYLFETIRWKTYINLNQNMTKHEVYHTVSKVANVVMNYDIPQADKEFMTRWELAQILVDSFNFENSWSSLANSQIERFIDNVKSFTEDKKLASLIF